MKKVILFLIVLLQAFHMIGQQDPEPIPYETGLIPLQNQCYQIEIKLPTNYEGQFNETDNLYLPDCESYAMNTIFEVSARKVSKKCSNFITNHLGEVFFFILYIDNEIAHQQLSLTLPFTMELDFKDFPLLTRSGFSRDIPIRVELYKYGNYPPPIVSQDEKYVQVKYSGDTFYSDSWLRTTPGIQTVFKGPNAISINGCIEAPSTEYLIRTDIDHEESYSSSTTSTTTGSLSYKFTILEGLDAGASFSRSETYTTFSGTSFTKKFRKDVSIVWVENKMVYLTSTPLYNLYERRFFIADCDGSNQETGTPIEFEKPKYIGTQLQYAIGQDASDPEPDQCEPAGVRIQIIDNGNIAINGNECNKSLMVLINDETEIDESQYKFEWSGPDGFTSSEMNLGDLPVLDEAIYSLTVTDACCNQYTTSIDLCSNKVYGEWYEGSSKDQYCREVTCEDGGIISRLNSDCTYTECVDVDFVYNSFDEHHLACVYDVVIQGTEEIIAERSVEAIPYTRYDEDSEECITEYYCNEDMEDVVYDEEAEIDFGDWELEEQFQSMLCVREILCNEERVEEEDIRDAVVSDNWEIEDDHFGDYGFICYAEWLCNDSGMEEYYSQEPELSDDWEVEEGSFDGFDCYTELLCDGNETGLDYTEEADVDYELINGECGYLLKCNGQYVDHNFNTFEPTFDFILIDDVDDEVDASDISCIKLIYCDEDSDDPIDSEDDITPRFEFSEEKCGEDDIGVYATIICEDDGFSKNMGRFCVNPEDIIGNETDKSLLKTNPTTYSGINIFPNPASAIFTISSESLINEIQILDKSGSGIDIIKNIQKNSVVLNKQQYSKGLYFLKVFTEDGVITEKLIIQ